MIKTIFENKEASKEAFILKVLIYGNAIYNKNRKMIILFVKFMAVSCSTIIAKFAVVGVNPVCFRRLDLCNL